MQRTHVDRGGTFTDVVTIHADGHIEIRKVPSDRAVVGELTKGPLTLGTTVATNALLERTGVRTLLVVNAGLEDLVQIGDMSRPDLFHPEARWPDPLSEQTIGFVGRLDAQGREVHPLDTAVLDTPSVRDALDAAQAVAVVGLHSAVNPAHERSLAQAIRARFPHLHVSVGHEVSPEVGLLARIETTLVDAAITPVLQDSMSQDRIPSHAMAMRSDGGLTRAQDLRAPDAVLSGPAGGVVAVRAIAEIAGFASAVGLDMGGTSTDVCRVDVGSLPRREGDVRVAGVRLRRPMLEVDTIAAGGGSVLWNDGLRLGVGPISAGADPGPQAYGRGGPPTLTDAAIELGWVDPLAFDPPLQPDRIEIPGDAMAFVDVAQEHMAGAIRRLAAGRGADVSDHALVAFGGAAGQHACAVADRVGIRTVLIHPCASVLSAWGQALAREEATAVQPVWAPLHNAWPAVQKAWAHLEVSLPSLGGVRRTLDVRVSGTDHILEVEGAHASDARTNFQSLHVQRFGLVRDGELQVVNARVRVFGPKPAHPPTDPNPFGLGEAVRTGPEVLHAKTTSVVIPSGWTARSEGGLLRIDRQRGPRGHTLHSDAHGVALWGQRFMHVAEQGGVTLQRLAQSVNIRERLDFSVAVFDEGGRLVANAPHIPVHLGAMGVTVRDLLHSHTDLEDGQAWVCNDPSAGGSHLPDLTVITAVHHQGRRFFVASRGHHADVGGRTPGSMPPTASHIDEEGVVLRHEPLLANKRLRMPPALQSHSRLPEVIRCDLEAQVAANHHAARELRALGPADEIASWMQRLQEVAAAATLRTLATLPQRAHVSDTIDSVGLHLEMTRDEHGLTLDFSKSGGPHSGNLNAPEAVVRAAVLYALRVLADQDIPLNEGALRHVQIVLSRPSILSPPPTCAVAGGNVETSMRIVDLVLRAAGRMASSCGSMSNLTLGGPGWTLYETIGGGQGASRHGHGANGRQVHMTNTRATDPEVLETRLPVRLHTMAYRPQSGGLGRHVGGNGLIRELELLKGGTAALLATRRVRGAPGLQGGEAGKPGADEICSSQNTVGSWDGQPVQLAPGDRIRISTPGGGGWGPAKEESD